MRLFSEQELKIFLIIFAAVLVMALTITILTVSIRRGRQEQMSPGYPEKKSAEIDIKDLVIPEDFNQVWRSSWYPSRPKRDSWTEEQVQMYWAETNEILMEHFEEESRILIEEILDQGKRKE